MRSAEIAKYAEAYQRPGYAMGDERRAAVARILAGTKPGTLIDVGTGRGETLAMAAAAGFTVLAGTEVVPALCGGLVVYAEAWALPFADQSADLVTCFDVLEHLLHDDQPLALAELVRVGREVIVTAADYSHFEHGVEYHVGRRPYPEWESMLQAFGTVEPLGWCGSAMGWRVHD
ncbi:MAG: hypothetical protein QG586_582 [Pseudomonadota bacterium]|nr:hypothetical protein [Pseudomonadota bacterium]